MEKLKNNFFDTLVYKTVFSLEHGLPEQSVGLDGAKRIMDRVREKIPDAQYVAVGDTDCIIYRDQDAHKVMDLLDKRVKHHNGKITECKTAMAKILNGKVSTK